MLITINGPYQKHNQLLGTIVSTEIKKLYPDMKIFLYDNPPSNELDKPINVFYKFNPFLHISSILSQMAIDIQTEEGENKPPNTCVRDYVDRTDTLVIATEWYSSAILRVLRYIKPYESLTNLADILATQDRLVDFAFNLVKEFQFTAPDLNIVFIPNELEMDDDTASQVKPISKERAKQTKDIYTSYMNLTTNDSYNIFTRNGESYGPIYVLNRSNVIIPETKKTITTRTPNFLKERYENFHKKMLEHQQNFKTQAEIVQDITDIIKTYIDIVNKSIEVAASSALTPIRS